MHTTNVVGVGDVDTTLSNECVWTLQQVKNIPNLKKNVISLNQLDDKSHVVAFFGEACKVTKGTPVLAHGKKTGILYLMLGSNECKKSCCKMSLIMHNR